VGGDKIRRDDAVSIEKDDIGCGTTRGSSIPGCACSKSEVLLPYVKQRVCDASLHSNDDVPGSLRRTVVGHDDLEIVLRATPEALEYFAQRVRPVIRRHDHR
jgi:hypothetical protein